MPVTYELSEEKFLFVKRNNYIVFSVLIVLFSLLLSSEVYFLFNLDYIIEFGFFKLEIILFLFLLILGLPVMGKRMGNIKQQKLIIEEDALFVRYSRKFVGSVKLEDIESIGIYPGRSRAIKKIRLKTPYSQIDLIRFDDLEEIYGVIQKKYEEQNFHRGADRGPKIDALRRTRFGSKVLIILLTVLFMAISIKFYSMRHDYSPDWLFTLFEVTARYYIYLIATIFILSHFIKMKIFKGFKYKSLVGPVLYLVTVIILSLIYVPLIIRVLSLS